MIEVHFRKSKEQLTVLQDGQVLLTLWAWSKVRNELDGERPNQAKLPDLFHSELKDRSQGPVAMPRPFPTGRWNLVSIEQSTDQFTQPIFIRTDAHQPLDVWALDSRGQYSHKTGQTVDDWGYLIHFPNGSNRTQGCTGMTYRNDIIKLCNVLEAAIHAGPVPYIVEE